MKRSWSLAIMGAITAAPLFAGRFLPFSDLPEHVAAIGSLQHWNEPGYRIAEHYTFAWGESQYLLYHFVGALLAHVTGSAESANKILLALVAFAYPFAARSLLRALDRDERLALFACPLFWNHALTFGLLPFVASVPLVLFGLAAVVRQACSPTRRRLVVLSVFGLLLFHLHVSALLTFLVSGVAITFAIAIREEKRSAIFTRFAWVLPSLVALVVWASVSRIGLRGESLEAPGQIVFSRARQIRYGLSLWSQDPWRSHFDEVLAVVFWLLLAAIAIDAFLARRDRAPSRFAIVRWIPLVVGLLLYVALPYRIGAADSLNLRMALFLPPFVLIAIDARAGRPTRLALGGAALLTIAGSINDAYEIRAAQRELGDFDRILDAMGPGTRALALDFHPSSSRTHVPPWVHVVAYHRARNGGVSEPSFSTLGHWPIHFRPEAAPPPKNVAFWEFQPGLFRNATDGAYFDYVLVHGDYDPFERVASGPQWVATARERDWTLYVKRSLEARR